jgi:hypothetical protein
MQERLCPPRARGHALRHGAGARARRRPRTAAPGAAPTAPARRRRHPPPRRRSAPPQRLQACQAKGFPAVAAGRLDAYAADSGFGLTAADQLEYSSWLAASAHGMGLGVGLRGGAGLAGQLAAQFDFFVSE